MTIVCLAARRERRDRLTLRVLLRGMGYSAVALLLSWGIAKAQLTSPLTCSGSVGLTAAAVTFTQTPQQYVTIFNASSSGKFWINPVGGTAAANTAGSFSLEGEGNYVTLPAVAAVSIISTVAAQPYTCFYQ